MTCDRFEREGMLGHLGDEMPAHVEECPDCRARSQQYARLAALLAQASQRPLPPGWKERTLARLEETRAGRNRRAAVTLSLAVAAAAAAFLLIYLWPQPGPGPEGPAVERTLAQLAIRIERGAEAWRGNAKAIEARPGDVLHLAAPSAAGAHAELRLYREEREVLVRCPGAPTPTCRHDRGIPSVTWTLPTAGAYQALWLVSSSPLPPPTGDLRADTRAALRSGAHVQDAEQIDVY